MAVSKVFRRCFSSSDVFAPKRAVILSKLTRYSYEKLRYSDLDEGEFKAHLLDRGSDYYGLKERHLRHEEIMNHVESRLSKRGIKTTIVSRADYTADSIKDADMVLAAGGDGTFLLAASQIRSSAIPLIGVNTDPEKSVGALCLPTRYSLNFDKALDKLLSGQRRWLYRKRIRITMSGKHQNDEPVQLLLQQLQHPEQRFSEHVKEHEQHTSLSVSAKDQPTRILPILALNDVFIGESLSARVSYYELSVDGCPSVKQKSSGITVCTGTGSSSWHFNINSLQQQDIKEILRLTKLKTGLEIPYADSDLVKCIYSKFNKALYFSPTAPKMAFTVRDPVHTGIFGVSLPRGFGQKLEVRSKMWDACLVIDGGVSFRFNDGAAATMELHEKDELKTVQLD